MKYLIGALAYILAENIASAQPHGPCCKALTAECMACAAGMSVHDFCQLHKDEGIKGCPTAQKYNCLIKEDWSPEKIAHCIGGNKPDRPI